jgi:parallel beta-helix repeat protein
MPRFLAFIALLAAGIFGPARAETTECVNITSLPAVITSQGNYCLKQDLSTVIATGAAIAINTNNVTLDCNNWKIGGAAAGLGTNARGIGASNRLNITIRNCGIRGFYAGIELLDGAGHLVEDNRLDQNTFVGIQLRGDGNVVRHNRIVDTGGRPESSASYGINIYSGSSGTLVRDNIIINVTATAASSLAFGMRFGGIGHEIAQNLFSNILAGAGGTAYGTYGAAGAVASLRDNTAFNPAATAGVGIDGGDSASHCKGNSVHGFNSGQAYCTDFGGNSAN